MPSTTADAFAFDMGRERRLKRIARIARLMDTAVRVPGTNIRFGADSMMGLVPGVGDAAGGLIGLFLVNEARKLGVPNHKIARMLANIGIDVAVGAVPLLGDVFDVYFKAHRRNLNLILEHFGEHGLAEKPDLEPAAMKDITPRR
ncbi:DUF4112 domain-containing protein [Aurantimonas sp. Leaf443]|uniref:DUF4112 domain-containing protein n=1 Tax=Aurantimonas sp. Leaf443 TaxID=1736378 RepID=UPI0006F970FB|nr:DUF4112 domain-containing protein [Aurantimonas sp. Leaf443]KQT88329.1 hypothetical protein ASG48_02580 [Aurantimonas sp. Leaf443]